MKTECDTVSFSFSYDLGVLKRWNQGPGDLQSTSERLAEAQHTAPSFVKVLIRPFSLLFDKAGKNFPERMFNIGCIFWLVDFLSSFHLGWWINILCNHYIYRHGFGCFSTSLLDIFLCFHCSIYLLMYSYVAISKAHQAKHCS